MATKLQKQVSIYLPIDQWRALRAAAVREKIPITQLCRRLMASGVEKIAEEFGSKTSKPASSKLKPSCK